VVYVNVVDDLGSFRGVPITRTSKGYLRLSLVLPRSITLTAFNETVVGPPGLQAALTQQRLNLLTSPTITIQLVASLQWPYVITSSSLVAPPGISGTLTATDSSKCLGTTLSPCFQRFTFSLEGLTGAVMCNLTGSYLASFTVQCRGTPQQCPLGVSTTPPPSVPASFSFSLVSPQFCTPVTIDVHLTETVTSYSSVSRTSPAASFLPGQTVFFFVDVQSSVTLSSLQVLSVTFQ